MRPDPFVRASAFIVALVLLARCAFASTTDIVTLRGHPQLVHLYGTRSSSPPVIVSSGDGGWIHLGPHIAEVLAARGYFVIGFNAKAYLESFTMKTSALQPADVPGDYRELVRYAAGGSPPQRAGVRVGDPGPAVKPILIGVSEGAGLSVLAAADGPTKAGVGGVIAIGLPDVNELGWRWKDAWIYVTHGIPNEPTFSSAALVGRMAPVPLAAIHSTGDEFVPVDREQQMMARASDPKKLWVIQAADHRFSDNLSELDRKLIEAMAWLKSVSSL